MDNNEAKLHSILFFGGDELNGHMLIVAMSKEEAIKLSREAAIALHTRLNVKDNNDPIVGDRDIVKLCFEENNEIISNKFEAMVVHLDDLKDAKHILYATRSNTAAAFKDASTFFNELSKIIDPTLYKDPEEKKVAENVLQTLRDNYDAGACIEDILGDELSHIIIIHLDNLYKQPLDRIMNDEVKANHLELPIAL